MTQFEARERRSNRKRETVGPVRVQRKLVVGSVSDPAEAEADLLADAAMRRMTSNGVEPLTQTGAAATRVRRFADTASASGGPVGPELGAQINGARNGGTSLDGRTLQRMESGFGADFSNVRVHHDTAADSLNQSLQARAFTTGSDIFFRDGEYRPGSSGGDRLLAHELAHTMQQGSAPVRRRVQDDTIRREFTVGKSDWGETKTLKKLGEGSANGVFMLKTKSAALIVKGQSGAARSQLASEMMEASGAHGVTSRTIALASPEGAQLLKVMYKLAKSADKALPKNTPATDRAMTAVNTLASAKYDSVTVMPSYDNLSNLVDVARDDDVVNMLERMKKNGFFNGLGKIHAADMMMGNEDRLVRGDGLEPSLKNTFVNTWSGQAVGLDLDMNAQSLDQVTGDIRKDDPTTKSGKANFTGENAPSLAQHKYKDYVSFIIKGSSAKKKYTKTVKGVQSEQEGKMLGRGSSMNSGDMASASDPAGAARVFDRLVQSLVEEVRLEGAKSKVGADTKKSNVDAVALANSNWAPAKAQFLAGVAEGLANLSKKMPEMTKRADELTGQFGDDPFLDPKAFRVRDMYGQLLKVHDEPTTMKLLEKYAELLQQGGSDADFWAWHDLLYPPHTASSTAQPTAVPTSGEAAKPKRGFAAIRTPIGGRAKPRTAPAQVAAATQVAAPRRPITPIRSTGGRAKPRKVGE